MTVSSCPASQPLQHRGFAGGRGSVCGISGDRNPCVWKYLELEGNYGGGRNRTHRRTPQPLEIVRRSSRPGCGCDGNFSADRARYVRGAPASRATGTPAFGSPLRSTLEGADAENRLDLGCVASHRTFSMETAGCGVAAGIGNVASVPLFRRFPSGTDREGLWPAKLCHPIQDVACDQRFSCLRLGMTSPEPVANDRLVSEEGILRAGLLMVPRFLLPLATPDLLYSSDRAIACTGSPRSRRCLSRWDDDFRIACCSGLVNCDRVVGGVRREARDVLLNLVDEIKSSPRVVGIPVRKNLGDDRARPVYTEMELLPATLAAASCA